MQSLADFLGVPDPAQPGRPAAPAPSEKVTAKAFCKSVIASPEYRQSILNRITLGDLPPAVECLMWHYAHGKPTEHFEVKDTTNHLAQLSLEELEQQALFLADLVRTLRQNAEPVLESVH